LQRRGQNDLRKEFLPTKQGVFASTTPMRLRVVFRRLIRLLVRSRLARFLLNEIRESLSRHETFALENTLSGKGYVRTFKRALALDYDLELHYLWFSNVEQAIARVRRQVRMGGHNIPVSDVRRRFKRSPNSSDRSLSQS
jgi:predicted ABC-type ATPase